MDYILNQALEQIGAGADILDVNVGLPGIDEKEMMLKAFIMNASRFQKLVMQQVLVR